MKLCKLNLNLSLWAITTKSHALEVWAMMVYCTIVLSMCELLTSLTNCKVKCYSLANNWITLVCSFLKVQELSAPYCIQAMKKYLGIIATSVPHERLVSTAGNIITEKRDRLTPENTEMLILLHAYVQWILSNDMLQQKGFKINFYSKFCRYLFLGINCKVFISCKYSYIRTKMICDFWLMTNNRWQKISEKWSFVVMPIPKYNLELTVCPTWASSSHRAYI